MSISVDTTPIGAVVPAEDTLIAAEDVEGSRPRACWSVREGDWSGRLPAEMAALLAPPVIVSAEAFTPALGDSDAPRRDDDAPLPPGGAPPRDNVVAPGPGRPSHDNGVPAAYGPRHAAPDDATSRYVTPGLPRRLRARRPARPA